MRVLAIDTALGACAVAVFDTESGGILASASVAMARGHAEQIMPMLARVMREASLAPLAVDRIAVTTGPGSFTGLRVGIAAARGIALAAGRPAVGVSTLAAFAAPHLAADAQNPVVAVIDARHDHVFMQTFGAGGRSAEPPRLAPMSEAVRAVSGPGVCIVGSAASAVAGLIAPAASRPPVVDDRTFPDIAWVARMGAVLPASRSPPRPQYLRAPDAQPQNAARLPRR